MLLISLITATNEMKIVTLESTKKSIGKIRMLTRSITKPFLR